MMKKRIVLAITTAIVMSTVLSCDPAKTGAAGAANSLEMASRNAAEAVKTKVEAIKKDVDDAVSMSGFGLEGLNDNGQAKLIEIDTKLKKAQTELTGTEATGLIKLSEAAVAAAKKVKKSTTADAAVGAAEEVKTAVDATAEGSAQQTINAAVTEVDETAQLAGEDERTAVQNAAQAAQNAINALKELADKAEEAALKTAKESLKK